jgi:large subunit ribosomal protein L9
MYRFNSDALVKKSVNIQISDGVDCRRYPLRRHDMKVILRQNVQSLGKAGETIKVADGYARNFLIPKGLAAEANTRNLKTFEHEKQRILQYAEKIQSQAEETAAKLSGMTCTIARRVGEQEKLFGSVGVKDIEEALTAQGFQIDKRNILLEEPIKAIGEYSVRIKLSAGVTAEIKVAVVAEA